jgi:hypothetical protein
MASAIESNNCTRPYMPRLDNALDVARTESAEPYASHASTARPIRAQVAFDAEQGEALELAKS